uniref:Uncharacterized protein n=1 Tax=Aegilops tauschii subsp. strangulata TaxID=200361 RepID=A0A453JK35_AEGTS
MATQEIEKAPHAVRRRVVLFPLPFQGHLSPMLQLAELLRARGLAVTVLHTDFNAPDPARHPELAFVSIHEALPHEATSPDADIVAQLLALNSGCEAPFREALASLLLLREDVACVVVDGQWYAALGAAGALGVPVLALRTDSAATFGSLLAFPRLRDAGYVPIKEKRSDGTTSSCRSWSRSACATSSASTAATWTRCAASSPASPTPCGPPRQGFFSTRSTPSRRRSWPG